MVASQPIERPDSPDFLINRLRELEQRVDELTRQSKYPFSISHNGVPDFTVLPNADNSGAIVSVYDGAGHALIQTDPDTKYGLARPEQHVPMYQVTPGAIYNSSTTFVRMLAGTTVAMCSSFAMQWILTVVYGGGGAAAVAQTYAVISDPATGYATTTTTTTTPSTTSSIGDVTTVSPFAITLPPTVIGNRLGVDIYTRISAGGSQSSVAAQPIFAAGVSRATAVGFGAA
ncbi:hypothetical protein [Amycolatopsis sp. lyj-346]|uniref:hypothetical protein n=1 Tax=Amycolatopsis sp. lyj-346 TaxID=2789289 RepID=UPI00397D2DDA